MNLFDIRKEKGQVLLDFDEHLKLVLERRYLDLLNMSRLELEKDARLDGFVHNSDVRLFRLDEICYEEDASRGLHLMNMQNVLSSVKHDDFSVVLIVKGDEEKVSLYYGLARKPSASDDSPDTYSYSDVLNRALQGNFLDISLSPLSGGRCDGAECQDDLVRSIRDMAYVSALTGIPSTRLKDREGPYVQGLERFIDAMQGERYCLMVLAEPISLPQLNEMSRKLFEIGSEIHSQVTATVQKMKGSSDTVNIGLLSSRSTSESDMVGISDGHMFSRNQGIGNTETYVKALTNSTSETQADGTAASAKSLARALSRSVSNTVSSSLSKSESFTRSIAKTLGSTLSFGAYGGYAHTWTRTTAVSREVLNKSAQDCEALCDAYVNRLRGGKNLGFWNVGIYVMMDKDRRENDLRRAEGLLRAALSGDETHWEPIRTIRLSHEVCRNSLCKFSHPQYSPLLYGEEAAAIDEKASFLGKLRRYAGEDAGGAPGAKEARVAYWLREFSRREGGLWDLLVGLFRRRRNKKVLADILDAPDLGKGSKDMQWAWRQLRDSGWGHPFGAVMGGVSTPLNTEELAIVMNLPRHEIQGVSVRQTVPFGVNYRPPREAEKITIGRILVKRALGSSLIYSIPAPLLKKHLFVCGVTGSGKTNTCIRLLRALDKPFMVIEPAKTEYRQMLARDSDVKVFTLGDERCSPFRINPFAFVRGGSLLTHIDCLKSVFNGAFPMYAAMPYILEEAILEVYLDKGWNLVDSTNRFMKSEQDRDFDYYLPTMKDLYRKIEEVVKRKRYAEEASTNYRASLQARVSSLMVGSKGAMLNTRHSTPLEELLRSKVVIELKNLGDDEEKCFIMGLLLSSIYEYRECRGRLGSELQHILMIEEAHRLLKRTPDYVSPEVGNSRGKAVDAFANMLSEVREYGQGVVIVDQIPTKLASEVIKNTNTKIVHRTLAQDDRLCVGETMNLNEAQTKELALLPVGEAVIYREGMEKAFRVKVDFAKDYEEMISDERCREAMDSFHKDKAEVYAPYVLDGKLEKDLELSRAILRQDFRCFRHELAGSIGGALYLMLRGKDIESKDIESVVAEARKCFEKTARSCLTRSEQTGEGKTGEGKTGEGKTGEGKTGEEQEERFKLLAHAAHYADEFFVQLGGILGHDRALKLNRIFFQLWDGEKQNREMSAFLKNLRKESERKESKLKNTLLKSYWDDPELQAWWGENEKKQGIEGLNRVLDFKLSEFLGNNLSDALRKELKLDIARQIFGDDKDSMERLKKIPGWNREEVESDWCKKYKAR